MQEPLQQPAGPERFSIWKDFFQLWFVRGKSASTGIQRQIEAQQLALTASSGRFIVAGAFCPIAVLFYLLHDHYSWSLLVPWTLLICLTVLATFIVLLRIAADDMRGDLSRWHWRWAWLTLIHGALWGATSWLFLPAPAGYDRDSTVVITAVIMVVASAGATAFVYYPPVFVTWILACLLIGAGGLLRLGGTLHLVVGVATLVLAAILLRTYSTISEQILAALRLALENQALLRDKETLLHQLEERTRAAEYAKEKAEEASFVRLRFLSAASHDLRQPVHVIGLRASELLERTHETGQRSIVEKIVQSTETLEERFDAILGAAQLQMGRTKPNIDDFPVSQLLTRIDTGYAPQALAHGLAFEVRASTSMVRTDLNLLTSLVGNFVSNAIRYARSGKVLVRCRERAGVARIQVWDTGPGIDRSEFKVIFEEFVRLDHPGVSERGHGMGLAIVRGLAEALGLRIGVRSKIGKGSLFWVELPLVGSVLSDTAGNDLRALQQANEKITGAFVVIVDDEEEVLATHRSLLRQWGCHVVAATSAQAALTELEAHERIPDVLLCDYQLGHQQTGVEAVRAIRAAQAYEIPAIILTGDITVVDQLQTALPQCVVVTKPLRASKLRPALLQALSHPV